MGHFEEQYPHITEWVEGWGWIEIGYDEGPLGFVRALDIGGLIWESGDKTYDTLTDALTELDQILADKMDELHGT